MEPLIALALVGFLTCLFLMDTVQVLLRAISAILTAPVLGAHLGSVFMLTNRAATALSLVLIAYLVDVAVEAEWFLMVYAVCAMTIALSHLILSRPTYLLRTIFYCFRTFYGKALDDETVATAARALSGRSKVVISPAVLAVTVIGFLGLLIPSILASKFPIYRATLMQTGFVLNALATVFSVLHVEREIAVTLDRGDPTAVSSLYQSYNFSRMLGYVAGFGLFMLTLAGELARLWP